MKKLIIGLGIIVCIGGAYYIGSHRNTENHNWNNKNYSQRDSDNYKTSNKKYNNDKYKENDNYSEVNGVPFNKGYNGDYDKAAVEKANKDHQDVSLNKEYTVAGVDSVPGAKDCTYVRDVDGDTLISDINGKNESIRFYGIDSSEDVNPRIKCIEPYSVQAKNFVESKLQLGSTIKILFNNNKGKYGRSVGTIYYQKNGLWYNLNEEEVANGLARIAYLDKNNNNINVDQLYNAEDSAKAQKLNIWSIKGYVTKLGYNLAIFK